MTHKEFGDRGEYLARLFLEKKGFVFIRANYRSKHGEIDLVMQENDEIVFVEVKTRTFRSAKIYGRGSERIDKDKQKNIIRSSRAFIREEPRLCNGLIARFDTVELYMDSKDDRKIYVFHTPCAFGLSAGTYF
ncbi:MAG: YraN family protein [Clostridia bacterium]|nr:YraN family protein [Clostridia bacterium]